MSSIPIKYDSEPLIFHWCVKILEEYEGSNKEVDDVIIDPQINSVYIIKSKNLEDCLKSDDSYVWHQNYRTTISIIKDPVTNLIDRSKSKILEKTTSHIGTYPLKGKRAVYSNKLVKYVYFLNTSKDYYSIVHYLGKYFKIFKQI